MMYANFFFCTYMSDGNFLLVIVMFPICSISLSTIATFLLCSGASKHAVE